MVVEKAYAKFHGSYEIIEGGWPDLCLRDLTGAPSYSYNNDIEDAWEKINDGNKLNYVMVAETKHDDIHHNISDYGLVAGHAYTLLGTATVQDSNGEECQIVQLRNPWAHTEWNGDWSDRSSCWTD